MSCKPAYFNGWGTCKKLLQKMNGSAIQDYGETWTDANAETSSVWQTQIADDDKDVRTVLPIPVLSFENTTDDVSFLTSSLNEKFKDGDPIPSGTINLKASLLDYKHLHALEGAEFEFIPFFQGGSFWMTRKSDGTLKGFTCKLFTKAGLPPEDKLASFPLYLSFSDYEEFEDVVVITPEFKFSDILAYTPAALDIRVTTDYSAGDVTILATKRGSGDPMTGLDQVTDWEIMRTSISAVPVVATTTVVENGQGSYTLTVEEDSAGTPANLSAEDWFIIQAHDDDATNLTYISHSLKIFGGA